MGGFGSPFPAYGPSPKDFLTPDSLFMLGTIPATLICVMGKRMFPLITPPNNRTGFKLRTGPNNHHTGIPRNYGPKNRTPKNQDIFKGNTQ